MNIETADPNLGVSSLSRSAVAMQRRHWELSANLPRNEVTLDFAGEHVSDCEHRHPMKTMSVGMPVCRMGSV